MSETDPNWVQWAIGGVVTLLGVAIGVVRQEDKSGRTRIWERLNERSDKDADARLADDRRYATREDLTAMEARLDQKLTMKLAGQTEAIRQVIAFRPPVRGD